MGAGAIPGNLANNNQVATKRRICGLLVVNTHDVQRMTAATAKVAHRSNQSSPRREVRMVSVHVRLVGGGPGWSVQSSQSGSMLCGSCSAQEQRLSASFRVVGAGVSSWANQVARTLPFLKAPVRG